MLGWRLGVDACASKFRRLTRDDKAHVCFSVPGVLTVTHEPATAYTNRFAIPLFRDWAEHFSVSPAFAVFGPAYVFFDPLASFADFKFAEVTISAYFTIIKHPRLPEVTDRYWADLYNSYTEEGLVMSEDQAPRKRSRPAAIKWPKVEVETIEGEQLFKCAESGEHMDSRYYLTVSNVKRGAFFSLPHLVKWIRDNVQDDRAEKLVEKAKVEWEQPTDIGPPGENDSMWREVPGAEPVGVYLKAQRQRKTKSAKKAKKEVKENKISLSAGVYWIKPGGGGAIRPVTDATQLPKMIRSLMTYKKKHGEDGLLDIHTRISEGGLLLSGMTTAEALHPNATIDAIGGVDRSGAIPTGPGIFIPTRKVTIIAPKGVHVRVPKVEEEPTEPTEEVAE